MLGGRSTFAASWSASVGASSFYNNSDAAGFGAGGIVGVHILRGPGYQEFSASWDPIPRQPTEFLLGGMTGANKATVAGGAVGATAAGATAGMAAYTFCMMKGCKAAIKAPMPEDDEAATSAAAGGGTSGAGAGVLAAEAAKGREIEAAAEPPGHGPGEGNTRWADQAFQVHGKQKDFDKVMSAPEDKRERMYEVVKQGWGEGKWANDAFQLKGSQEDFDRVMAAPEWDRQQMYEIVKNGWSPTKFADDAFQIKGSQADFDAVMAVPEAERQKVYESIKVGSSAAGGGMQTAAATASMGATSAGVVPVDEFKDDDGSKAEAEAAHIEGMADCVKLANGETAPEDGMLHSYKAIKRYKEEMTHKFGASEGSKPLAVTAPPGGDAMVKDDVAQQGGMLCPPHEDAEHPKGYEDPQPGVCTEGKKIREYSTKKGNAKSLRECARKCEKKGRGCAGFTYTVNTRKLVDGKRPSTCILRDKVCKPKNLKSEQKPDMDAQYYKKIRNFYQEWKGDKKQCKSKAVKFAMMAGAAGAALGGAAAKFGAKAGLKGTLGGAAAGGVVGGAATFGKVYSSCTSKACKKILKDKLGDDAEYNEINSKCKKKAVMAGLAGAVAGGAAGAFAGNKLAGGGAFGGGGAGGGMLGGGGGMLGGGGGGGMLGGFAGPLDEWTAGPTFAVLPRGRRGLTPASASGKTRQHETCKPEPRRYAQERQQSQQQEEKALSWQRRYVLSEFLGPGYAEDEEHAVQKHRQRLGYFLGGHGNLHEMQSGSCLFLSTRADMVHLV